MRSTHPYHLDGTGAARLLQAQDAPTHYLDGNIYTNSALERFKKDFA